MEVRGAPSFIPLVWVESQAFYLPSSNPVITACPPSVAKTARGALDTRVEAVSRHLTAAVFHPAVSSPSSGLPVLAPRDKYVKLQFNGDVSTDTKLR